MASQDWFDKDFYKILGVDEGRQRRRAEEDLPQARPQVSPGLQPGRCEGGGEVQGGQRGVLGALRPRAAQGVRPDPRDGLGRALHRGRPGPAASRTCSACSARAAAARQQSPQDFDDIFSDVQPAAGRRLRLRPVRAVDRRLPRLRRSAARRRRHRAHDDRLHHRDQGRDHHAAGRGRQAVQGEDPRGRLGRAEDPPARPRPALAGRRRDGRYRRAGDRAPASRVHPRRAQPARDRAGDLHRGGARRHDRGADARRRPRQAARRARHAVGPRAARQGPRGADRRRAPATCSPRCRSRCRRTWTTPRAKRSSGSTSSSPRRTRAPT